MRQLCNESNDICSRVGQPAETTDRYDAQSPCSRGRRPMLEHVILKLKASGFTEIVINIHHFGEQIIDFLKANNDFGLTLHISDERDLLLDTGGGIRKARRFFENSDEPFLVHNVDILSDMNLKELYDFHCGTEV